MGRNIRMLDLHSALSCIHHGVTLELEGLGCSLDVRWNPHTYLTVEVECPLKHRQAVHDRLMRGAIQGEYDYRFSGICYQPDSEEERQWLSARVDLHYVQKNQRHICGGCGADAGGQPPEDEG